MRLADIARRQHGVFSRRQVLASGLSAQRVRRRVLVGTWIEVVNEVYADAGLVLTPAAWQWAAVLGCGTQAVLSHRSAAQVWAMPVQTPARPEVTVPLGARPRPGPQVRVHNIALPGRDVRTVRGLRLTSRQRTVLDCLLALRPDEGRMLLDRALQRGWVQLPGIAAAVNDARGRWGAGTARLVLAGADPGTASEAERLAQGLLRAGGVTGWVSGYRLLVGGQVVAVLDLAFPDVLLAIEIDGWAWHSDPERFQRDRRRQNVLVAAGWTVLRFTWADLVERPGHVLATVRSALARLAA
jgi:very-short-patch-repair endonuclease